MWSWFHEIRGAVLTGPSRIFLRAPRLQRFLTSLVLGILLVNLMTENGQGAQWSAEPSLGIKGEYNSNLLLSSTIPASVFGHWVSPGVEFGGSTERLEITGRAAADFIRYYGDRNVGITNIFLPAAVAYKTERDRWTFDGGFTRDNTLMSELRQTGAVLTFTQRNLWKASPTWTHALTEKLNLLTTYEYSNASYENGSRLGLFDYELHTATSGFTYSLTENDQLQTSLIYSYFRIPDAKLTSNIAGLQIGAVHMFTESLKGTLGGGPRRIASDLQSDQGVLSDSETVWVFTGAIEKTFETITARLNGGREIFPSGFGLLLKTDRVGGGLTKQLTENVSASLTGQVYFVEGIATKAVRSAITPSRYVTVTPNVVWRLSQWMTATLSYSYSQRQSRTTPDSAEANSVYFMLTYFPPKLSISR